MPEHLQDSHRPCPVDPKPARTRANFGVIRCTSLHVAFLSRSTKEISVDATTSGTRSNCAARTPRRIPYSMRQPPGLSACSWPPASHSMTNSVLNATRLSGTAPPQLTLLALHDRHLGRCDARTWSALTTCNCSRTPRQVFRLMRRVRNVQNMANLLLALHDKSLA
jgi:hypothetical protein